MNYWYLDRGYFLNRELKGRPPYFFFKWWDDPNNDVMIVEYINSQSPFIETAVADPVLLSSPAFYSSMKAQFVFMFRDQVMTRTQLRDLLFYVGLLSQLAIQTEVSKAVADIERGISAKDARTIETASKTLVTSLGFSVMAAHPVVGACLTTIGFLPWSDIYNLVAPRMPSLEDVAKNAELVALAQGGHE